MNTKKYFFFQLNNSGKCQTATLNYSVKPDINSLSSPLTYTNSKESFSPRNGYVCVNYKQEY